MLRYLKSIRSIKISGFYSSLNKNRSYHITIGFILKYLIMDHTTDDKVLVPAMNYLQEQYGGKIISASFDKCYYLFNWRSLYYGVDFIYNFNNLFFEKIILLEVQYGT